MSQPQVDRRRLLSMGPFGVALTTLGMRDVRAQGGNATPAATPVMREQTDCMPPARQAP
ncbi:MAG TPA: hypothetical protein VGW38_22430 [Chloroflexota bacterium]|nr:hypothetical protein [Chloroflexota bacterium]